MGSERPLAGKVALITGAGSGIGRGIAIGYAAAGASISCAGRTLATLQETVRTIEDQGGRAIAVRADVTDAAACEAGFELALGIGPVGFDLSVLSVFVKINPGTFIGILGGIFLFRVM